MLREWPQKSKKTKKKKNLLRKMSYWVFCPFFDWVVWFFFFYVKLYELFIYILIITPSLSNYLPFFFSDSEGGLFILLIASFAMQKFLNLIRFHLVVFDFLFCLRWQIQKYCCDLCGRMFFLCFLPGILWFKVLH